MRFSSSLFPQNYLVLGGNWNLWKGLFSMMVCKGRIAKCPRFCFCKSQDLCVRESRETLFWIVLIFPATSDFWAFLHRTKPIIPAPSFSDSVSVPLLFSSSIRGAACSAYHPPIPELHRDQPCTQGLFLLLQLKINSQLGSNGFPQNQKYVFSRLESSFSVRQHFLQALEGLSFTFLTSLCIKELFLVSFNGFLWFPLSSP